MTDDPDPEHRGADLQWLCRHREAQHRQVDSVQDAVVDWAKGGGEAVFNPGITNLEETLNSRAFSVTGSGSLAALPSVEWTKCYFAPVEVECG